MERGAGGPAAGRRRRRRRSSRPRGGRSARRGAAVLRTTPESRSRPTWYNAGKRVVEIDVGPRRPAESSSWRWCATADVLVEDWRPGREPWTAEELMAANPRLVRVSVTPMGEDGPWSKHRSERSRAERSVRLGVRHRRRGHAAALRATATRATTPSGCTRRSCTLAAARASRLTGDEPARHALRARGPGVMHRAGADAVVVSAWHWNGEVAKRQGSLHWSGAYEVYPGEDGRGVMVTAALQLRRLCAPLDEGETALPRILPTPRSTRTSAR